MNAWGDLAIHPLVYRLGWALVHSVWQIAAVAGALAVAMALLPKRRPELRYAAACGALLAALVLFVGTMFLAAPPAAPASPDRVVDEWHEGPARGAGIHQQGRDSPATHGQDGHATTGERLVAPPGAAASNAPPPAEPSAWRLDEAIRPVLPWLVTCWLIGVLAMGAWHAGGLALTWRLCRRGADEADETVLAVVRATARRLGVRQVVRVVASARAAGPAVVGLLRPVILLPVGVLTGLTPEQLRAVIAHELAHIRRRDHLVNLLQVAVETLLFYHPAAWWIGRQIRRERESCCDELALSAGPSRFEYARALAAVAERGAARPRLALAAEGGSLMRRIQRLLSPAAAAGRADVLRRSALAGLLAVAVAAMPVSCSLNGPQVAASLGPAEPRMCITAVADAEGQYDVKLRLPDGLPGPQMRVLAGQAGKVTIGTDAATRQSFQVTVTPEGKAACATYSLILAVKGGFRQWTGRNVPWPPGEWKALAGHSDVAPPSTATQPTEVDIRAVRDARTQNEAIRLAKADDLPAVEHADRVVVEQVWPDKKRTVVTDAASIRCLREGLTVSALPPSGGETKWQIGFYRGETLLRQAWVFPYGEWGFQRPKGPSWTCGRNDALPKLIGELLAAPPATPRPAGPTPANVKAAEIDLATAENKLTRISELVRHGAAAKAELDQAEADVQGAKLRLELLKADTDAARKAVQIKLGEVDLAAAEKRLERAKQMVQKGLAPTSELDQAQADAQRASLRLELAKADTDATRKAVQIKLAEVDLVAAEKRLDRLRLLHERGQVPQGEVVNAQKDVIRATGALNEARGIPGVLGPASVAPHRLDGKTTWAVDKVPAVWAEEQRRAAAATRPGLADGRGTPATTEAAAALKPAAVRVRVIYGTGDAGQRGEVEDWIAKAVANAGSPVTGVYTAWITLSDKEQELYASMQGGRLVKARATIRDGQAEVEINGFKIGALRRTITLEPGERQVVKLTDYPAPRNVFIALEAPPAAAPPATQPAAAAKPPAVYAKVIFLLKKPPREKDRPEAWIATDLAARGHKNFMAVSGWVRLSGLDANKPTPIWDGESDWFDDGHKVWGCSVGSAQIISRTADGTMTVKITSFMSMSTPVLVKVPDKPGSRAITVVDKVGKDLTWTYVALHVGPPAQAEAEEKDTTAGIAATAPAAQEDAKARISGRKVLLAL